VGEEDTYADVIQLTRPEQVLTENIRQYTIEEWAREFHNLVEIYSKISHELKEFGIDFGGRILLIGPPGTDFETFVNHLAIEMPINLVQFRLSELIRKKQDIIEVIRTGFETTRRHSPCLLYLERLDILAATESQQSVVIQDELRETTWDHNEVLVVSSVHDPSLVDKEVLTLFNRTYSTASTTNEDRAKVFENVLQSRNDIDIGLITEMTDGWNFAGVKHLALSLYMSPPNDSGKMEREQMEQMINQSRTAPIQTGSGLGSLMSHRTEGFAQDLATVEKIYPDEFVDQLYLMAVGDDYTQTQRVIETLNANLPLSHDEQEFLSRYSFILTGSSEDRLARLLKAKRNSDRLKRIMGR
jgi:SpoVK/Ycf46/Vps4 family AAA+-type ATPase